MKNNENKIVLFFVDPNNATPQLNYPLIESLGNYNDILYISSVNRYSANYYQNNYTVKSRYIFFKIANRFSNKKIRQIIKIITLPAGYIRLFFLVLKYKPAIIHYNQIIFSVLDALFIKLFKFLGKKIILTKHNYIEHERKKIKSFENIILATVDRIICLSDYIKKCFDNKYANKIIVIEHGNSYNKEIEKFRTKIKGLNNNSEKFKILFIGIIREYKGVDILIEAINYLVKNKKLKNIEVKIAGNFFNNLFQKYTNQIKEFGLSELFCLENKFVDYKELIQLVEKTDIGILPYKKASQSGLPYIFFSLGKALIVTNVGALPEQVDKSIAEIAEPHYLSLAQKIIKLKERLDKKEINSENFNNFKTKHSWDNTVSKYNNLYKNLLK